MLEEKVEFALPVDADHKATELRPSSSAAPHMRAFHLAWLSLFTGFFCAFAPPPLLPVLIPTLRLSPADTAHGGIASVSGTVFARLLMGPACDLLGPRVASASASLLSASAVAAAACTVDTPTGFVVLRFLAGLSLGNFVANQYWMSSMFAPGVVGVANGFSAGWANVGSGVTQLAMPLAYSLLVHAAGLRPSAAWRAAFLLPAALQVAAAVAVLSLGQDLPDGNFSRLRRTHQKPREEFWKVVGNGVKNYKGWVLALTYGYCNGVELTMENIIAEYFYERFELGIEAAGLVASCFGVVNVVSRPSGGLLSDLMGRRFGMRGRLWSLWAVQTAGGLLCILLGRMSSLGSSVAVMFGLSLFVQAASGLTFGVVPFVSRR